MDNGDPKINLHIKEDNLDMIGSNKYLGVQIESELKWREHRGVSPWLRVNAF